jgi:deazaflavin-dependent oxidoreductase (nitroreductase family)
VPLPRALARFNVRVTNPVLRPLVTRLPWFAIVTHVGRRSGRHYETPLMLFRRDGQVVIAMTYGPDTEWAKNVLAAGGCEARTRRGSIHLAEPRRARDPRHRLVPRPIGLVLRLLGADDVLLLRMA